MADNNGGFDDDNDDEHGSSTSFSQLLFSDDAAVLGLEDFNKNSNSSYSCFSAFSGLEKPPKMLCFGGDYNQQNDLEIVVNGETQKSAITCSDSSSASSGNNNNNNNNNNNSVLYTPPKSTKKRNGSVQEPVLLYPNLATIKTQVANQRTSKKTKDGDKNNNNDNNPSSSSSTGHARAKKEKLGNRILALQQLVSPFGKTDTASVLHEAMGYIKFLQDQVQVLCSPYLQHHPQLTDGGENGGEEERERRRHLTSRGLCLVPVACTVHVANNNGADFWLPAMGSNVTSSESEAAMAAAAAATVKEQKLKQLK